MKTRLICASHSPLLYCYKKEPADWDKLQHTFIEQRATIVAFDPELVIAFGSDHFNGFFMKKLRNNSLKKEGSLERGTNIDTSIKKKLVVEGSSIPVMKEQRIRAYIENGNLIFEYNWGFERKRYASNYFEKRININ